MGDDALSHTESKSHNREHWVHATVVDVKRTIRNEQVREVPDAAPAVAHTLLRIAAHAAGPALMLSAEMPPVRLVPAIAQFCKDWFAEL